MPLLRALSRKHRIELKMTQLQSPVSNLRKRNNSRLRSRQPGKSTSVPWKILAFKLHDDTSLNIQDACHIYEPFHGNIALKKQLHIVIL
ncbi:hypothetical protein CEXT_168381 [Caerostris extrusa]|uniref:Uncharacterized protein n=1 Tax=Caerostris extrusa TaxID=172846 RepID=A0AAV4Y5D2_CAEEX|nr:hypothetical protein CEXT_168381 [Caerostris extrusa]